MEHQTFEKLEEINILVLVEVEAIEILIEHLTTLEDNYQEGKVVLEAAIEITLVAFLKLFEKEAVEVVNAIVVKRKTKELKIDMEDKVTIFVQENQMLEVY